MAVGSNTITTTGFNNGGAECDDCQYKTRYKSNISACCRPKYSNSILSNSSNSSSTTTTTTSKTFPTVTYKVRVNGKWLPAVTNWNDYAGIVGKSVTDLAIKVNKGTVKYRVHVKGGGWLPYVTGYNVNDHNNGYAGNGKAIDAIDVYYTTPSDVRATHGKPLKAKYRVSPVNGNYYSNQYDNETHNGQDGYAGAFGKTIDRVQITLAY